jgi:hypothetical protein
LNSVLSNKLSDAPPKNLIEGKIGPNVTKDKLHNSFRKKLSIEEFYEKMKFTECLKINLTEEQRFLKRQIKEYEELVKFKTPMISS